MLLSVVLFIATLFASGCSKAPPAARALPDFALTAVGVDGESPFDRRALLGRAWVADFSYTRCAGPCPMLTANMRGLQARLPKKIGLLSFTVDPDHDSPEVLTEYARRFEADPQRWIFLTGEKHVLAKLFREGFQIAAAEDPTAPIGQNIAHTTKFVLIDSAGRLRGYYDGDDPTSLERLARDAAAL